MSMPKIVAAAIKFKPLDSEYYQIMCGKRHCNVLELMHKHGLDYHKVGAVQGFLTEDDQFLDRYDAARMAYTTGQLSKDTEIWKKIDADKEEIYAHALFSEDLW